MNNPRERKLDSGLSFRSRPCHGMFTPQRLIDEARGRPNMEAANDTTGDTEQVTPYLPHLSFGSVGITDMLLAKA